MSHKIPEAEAVELMLAKNLRPLESYPGRAKPWRCECLICKHIVTPRLAIGFSKDLQFLINEHVETFGYGPDGLILQTNGGKVFRYKGAIEMFRVAARTVGLRVGEGLHQLRHTCVSVLIAEGANPKEIQEWVGHASIEETMDTYGHLFPNAKHQLSSMLDKHAKRHSDLPDLGIAN